MRFVRATSAAVLMAGACFCHSATYYVSTTGKDTNPGSTASPWATLQHAVDTIKPGDIILVKAGTYVGCRIGNPGTVKARKTLSAAAGAHVVLDAPGPDNKHNSIVEVENFDFTMTDWTISGFEVENSPKYGIDVRVTNRIDVIGNTVHNSALTGIFTAFSDYVLIQGNQTYSNHEHGIYQSNSSTYPTIRANRSYNNYSCGIHMNGDLSEQPGNGLVLYALVEDNVIYGNGALGGSGINCDGVDHSMFQNNLLYGNHASGISLYGGDGAHSSSYNTVYNNTIVQATNSRYPMNIPDDGIVAPPVGNVVENNILYTPDTYHGSICVAGKAVPGFKSDYNVVVGRFSDNNDDSLISWAAWQNLGYDKHSVVATPLQLFVNPAAYNFQLKSGSPAINAGTPLADVPFDILGVPRPQGKGWDIGCYEYKTSA